MLPGITNFGYIMTTNQQYKTFFQDMDPRRKGGGELEQGTGSLLEWNIDSNRVHFAGPVGNIYQYEGHSRGQKSIYSINLWIEY